MLPRLGDLLKMLENPLAQPLSEEVLVILRAFEADLVKCISECLGRIYQVAAVFKPLDRQLHDILLVPDIADQRL